MANHRSAVAKATFAVSMLRPDPAAPNATNAELAWIHTCLSAVTTKCSRENMQQCKKSLLRHMTSPTRVDALGKYLCALSTSFAESEDERSRARSTTSGSSSKRKRLHLLFLLNDLFHQAKWHERDHDAYKVLMPKLKPYLGILVKLAASYDEKKNRKFHKEIANLIGLWKKKKYWDARYIESLQRAATEAPSDSPLVTGTTINVDAPYIMPAIHGRPNAPYHELPAGNMVPHIIPDTTTPILIRDMKPMQFNPGPANERLAKRVKDFLGDVEDIYRPIFDDEGIVADIDKMGQPLIKDNKTDELTVRDGYYGWSAHFCKMMRRQRMIRLGRHQRDSIDSELDNISVRGRRRSSSVSRSPSRDRSGDGSRRAFKRRYSPSRSPSRSRSRGYSRDRDLSRSRPRQRPRYDRRSSTRSRSRERRSRPYSRSRSRSRGPYRSRPRSYADPWRPPPSDYPPPPPPPPPSAIPQQPPPPLPFPAYNQGLPMGPGGLPLPPPPPPPGNFNGAWPFPPAPYPGYTTPMPPQNAGYPPSSSPPPPPPQWANQGWQQQQQYPRPPQDFSRSYGEGQHSSSPPQWQQGQHRGGYGYRGGGGSRGGPGWGR